MLRHIIPNIAASIVVQVATAMSAAIVLEAALDFLGLGTQPPRVNMLQASRQFMASDPVFAIAPGLLLTVFVISINLLASALTNALDPRIRIGLLRGRRRGRRCNSR